MKLIQLPPAEPEVPLELVEDLEALLSRVKSGEIQSFACSFVLRDGRCETYYNSGGPHRLTLLAGVWMLLSRLTDYIKEDN